MKTPTVGQHVMFTGDCTFGEIIEVFEVTRHDRNNHFAYALDPGLNVKILWDEKIGVHQDQDFVTCHAYSEQSFILFNTEQEKLFLKLKYPEPILD